MMFTRCPECESRFIVTASELRDAQAYVRCGSCQAVFSALDTLTDHRTDDSQAEPQLAPPILSPIGDEDELPQLEPESGVEPTADTDAGAVESSPAHHAAPAEPAPIEPTLERDDEPDRKLPPDPATKPTPPPPAELRSYQPPPPGTAPDPGRPLAWSSTAPNRTVELSLDELELDPEPTPTVERVIWSDAEDPEEDPIATPLEATLQIDLPLADDERTVKRAASIEPPDDRGDDSDVAGWMELRNAEELSHGDELILDEPPDVVDDADDDDLTVAVAGPAELPAEDRTTPWWLAAVAVLAGMLGAQVALSTEAGVEFRCRVLGCDQLVRKDLARIVALSTNIQRHPGIEGALVVSATLRNDAPFPQPYPIVEVKMTNVQGNVIAMRRFRPAEYIGDSNVRNAGITPGILVPVIFEVVDPGVDAVTFEFDFL